MAAVRRVKESGAGGGLDCNRRVHGGLIQRNTVMVQPGGRLGVVVIQTIASARGGLSSVSQTIVHTRVQITGVKGVCARGAGDGQRSRRGLAAVGASRGRTRRRRRRRLGGGQAHCDGHAWGVGRRGESPGRAEGAAVAARYQARRPGGEQTALARGRVRSCVGTRVWCSRRRCDGADAMPELGRCRRETTGRRRRDAQAEGELQPAAGAGWSRSVGARRSQVGCWAWPASCRPSTTD